MSWVYAGKEGSRYEFYSEMESRYGYGHMRRTIENKTTPSCKCDHQKAEIPSLQQIHDIVLLIRAICSPDHRRREKSPVILLWNHL